MNDIPEEEAASIDSVALEEWLARLAGASGVPGGGAACALMTATAAAMVGMVGGYAGDEGEGIVARAADSRRRALEAIERDALRSGELGDALRRYREDGTDAADRAARDAAVASAHSAAELGEVGVSLIADVARLLDVSERYLVPDIVVAAEGVAAGLAGASAIAWADLRLAEAHGDPGEDLRAVRERIGALVRARSEVDELRRAAAARV